VLVAHSSILKINPAMLAPRTTGMTSHFHFTMPIKAMRLITGSGYGVKTEVPNGKWQTLRVEFNGKKFTTYLNGKKLFDGEDDTFTDAGAVGVWTKADSLNGKRFSGGLFMHDGIPLPPIRDAVR
jgi:hypothetical protein